MYFPCKKNQICQDTQRTQSNVNIQTINHFNINFYILVANTGDEVNTSLKYTVTGAEGLNQCACARARLSTCGQFLGRNPPIACVDGDSLLRNAFWIYSATFIYIPGYLYTFCHLNSIKQLDLIYHTVYLKSGDWINRCLLHTVLYKPKTMN